MKKLLVAVIILGLCGFGYFRFISKPVAEKLTESKNSFIEVKRQPLRSTVSTTGRVIANLELEIKCKASGEVLKLPYDVSDLVKKDDVLVQLNPVDEERTMKRAQVALAVARARLAQAEVTLEIAESDLATERKRAETNLVSAKAIASDASAKFKRRQELFKSNLLSREEYEADKTADITGAAILAEANSKVEDLKSTERALELKKHDIIIAKAQVETNELSLAEAELRLVETKVLAPMDGVIVSRDVQVGQIISSGISNVGGGTTVLTMADLSHIFIVASVDESDIGRVEVGQEAVITADAFAGQKFHGKVVQIGTKGENASNVVTFEVKIEVKGNKRNLLKLEMTANIEIIAAERESALVLPVQVVRRKRQERFVTVIGPSGKGEQRTVEVGISNGEFYEILSGLKEGEKVMLSSGSEESRWRPGDSDNEARNARRAQRMGASMLGGGGRR